jgi:NAD(P)-dependent dehydrogenase (short-subunit alcohol dehydrogenase family)
MTMTSTAVPDGQATLAGKVAIVTGAGKGLGRAYALDLAQRGARVVVNNRRHSGDTEHSADAVVREICARGGSAVADYSDAADPRCGEHLLATALQHYGRLDIVIANAGVSEASSFHKQSLDEFRRIIEINLMGTACLLHPTFRHLYQQRGGAIVVSSSAAGLHGEHGLPAYSASKAGVIGLCRALALEGAAHGVRINTIAPFAHTAMTRSSLPADMARRLPPEAVAPVVAWLASDDCALNGEVVVAGGGRVARARNLLSTPVDLSHAAGAMEAAWCTLGDSAPTRDYASAVALFLDFAGDLPS